MGFLDSQKLNWFLGQAGKKFEAGDYRNALTNYLKALKLKVAAKEFSGNGKLYRSIGMCYMKMGDDMDAAREKHTRKAAEYFKKSAESFRDEGNPLDAGISFEFAANNHQLLEELELAAEFVKLAAEMYSEANEMFQSSHAHYNSAQYYEKLGDLEKASQAYLKAAELDIELNDRAKASRNYKSAGACFWKLGDYPLALDAYVTSAGLDDKIGDYVSASKAHEMIARCEEKLGKTRDAVKEHEKSYEIELKEGMGESAVESLLNEGIDYQKMGDHKNAVKTFAKAADISSAGRNHGLEGRARYGMAMSHAALGDYPKAIENFTLSAEANTLAARREDAYEAYKRAVDLGKKQAESFEASGDTASAAESWLKIAVSLQNLHDAEKSAEAYYKRATLLAGSSATDAAKEAFRLAAEAFGAANLPAKAAESYIKSEDYQKAADFYVKSALDFIKQNKRFESAQAYKTASWCYAKLNMNNRANDYSRKYAWQYHTFIDESEKAGVLEPEKKSLALKNIGEANYRIGLVKKALPPLKEALSVLSKAGNPNEKNLVSGELDLVSGLIDANEARWEQAIQKYASAKQKLSSVDKSGFDRFYSEFIGQLIKRTSDAVKDIESKPDVLLVVEQPESLMVGKEGLLVAVVSNKGVMPVKNIAFLPYCPEGLKAGDAPEKIEELPSKENRRVEFKLEPSEVGEYTFKPLEMLYQDTAGKKYMKASNEITVNAVVSVAEKRKAAEAVLIELVKRVEARIEEDVAGLPKGSIVLVSYDPQIYSHVYLAALHYLSASRGMKGVYIASGNPSKSIAASLSDVGVDEGNITFIDCISYMAGGTPEARDNVMYVENPELLERIERNLDRALASIQGEKFVVFDSVSSMLVYNDSKSLEEFIHSMTNKLRLSETLGVIFLARGDSTQDIQKTLTQFVSKEVAI